MTKIWYVWAEYPREVFKPGFNQVIERGIPFALEENSLFLDMFENDPNFVSVLPKEAEEQLKALEATKPKSPERIQIADKFVLSLKDAKAQRVKAWLKRRDELRAAIKKGGGK